MPPIAVKFEAACLHVDALMQRRKHSCRGAGRDGANKFWDGLRPALVANRLNFSLGCNPRADVEVVKQELSAELAVFRRALRARIVADVQGKRLIDSRGQPTGKGVLEKLISQPAANLCNDHDPSPCRFPRSFIRT